MDTSLIEIGSYSLNGRQLLFSLACVILWGFVYFLVRRSQFTLFDKENSALNQAIKNLILLTIHLVFSFGVLHFLGLNVVLFESKGFVVTVFEIFVALYILIAIRYLDRFGVALVSSSEDTAIPEKQNSSSPTQLIHLILMGIASILLVKNFDLDRGYQLAFGGDNELSITPSRVISVILVILIARLFYWLITNIFLQSFYSAKNVDKGIRFALNQLFAYVIFTIALLIGLQNLGVNMSLIWAGAAALLVGVGIGLQQTFSDIFAGITMLFERSIKVGDVLAINNTKGVVKKIGLRTSTIITPEKKRLIIPNSHLTNNDVNNWSKNQKGIRYFVSVGVAYGTDPELVKRLLLNVVDEIPSVRKTPQPLVRFDDFGDSALIFSVHFYSRLYMDIEDVQSDIRFQIVKAFEENDITIPFPQRDVWIRKD